MSDHRKVVVYRDSAGKYRWRLVAERGNLGDEIVADSGQGYVRKESAKEMAEDLFPGVRMVEQGGE